MSQGIVTVAYIGATIMFILALGGLSQPETSRRGNFYGMFGMAVALVATIIGIVSDNYFILFAGIIIGGSIGLDSCQKSRNDPDAGIGSHSAQSGWLGCSSWSVLPISWTMTPALDRRRQDHS